MYVRKVRNKNAIHPVKLTSAQVRIVKELAIPLEVYVKEYLKIIAKKRRWKWWFEREK